MTRLLVPDFQTKPDANASAFAQRLTVFDEALPTADPSVRQMLQELRTAVVRVRQELSDIHVSSLSTPILMSADCCKCGLENLEVFYTSKHGGYHLCEACFNAHDRHERGRCSHQSAETVFGQIP